MADREPPTETERARHRTPQTTGDIIRREETTMTTTEKLDAIRIAISAGRWANMILIALDVLTNDPEGVFAAARNHNLSTGDWLQSSPAGKLDAALYFDASCSKLSIAAFDAINASVSDDVAEALNAIAH